MKKTTPLVQLQILFFAFLLCFTVQAQVGVGTNTPSSVLDVETNNAADGIDINNTAGNGDPVLRLQVNGTTRLTMGIDDSDADKFKIGTTAITTSPFITLQTNRNIGFRTTAPSWMFHMTNDGVAVGAAPMGSFENLGASGVALTSFNNNTTTGYNGFEGVTNSTNTSFISAGVFGIALNSTVGTSVATIGVRGGSNEWQGTGVFGTRFNSGGPDLGWGGEFYDDIGYTGVIVNISDRKTKKNIQSISDALGIISELNPVTYTFDLEKYPFMGLNEELEYGFVAQEVREVLPEITRVKSFDTNATAKIELHKPIENKRELFLAMDYTRIIPILTKGIQEQQKTIDQQNQKIESLEERIRRLEVLLNGDN